MKKSLTAVVSGIAGVAVFAGVVIAASTIHIPNGSDPKSTEAVAVVVDYRTLEASPAHPAPVAAVVAEQAPADPPAQEFEPAYGSYPSGYAVPFIPSSDPENANGGEWAVDACASGSASTGGDGHPYCD